MPTILAELNQTSPAFFLDTLFTAFSQQVATVAVNLLLQTTLVLICGLVAAHIVRRRGAALQSCVLRMTLVATLICPVASWILSSAGVSGFRIELASAESEDVPAVEATPVIENPSPNSVVQDVEPSEPREVAEFDDHRMDRPAPRSMPQAAMPDIAATEPPIEAQQPIAVETAPENLQEPLSESPSPETPLKSSRVTMIYATVCGIWLCISGLFLVRLLVANLMMERLRRKSYAAPKEVVCDCRDIAQLMSVTAPPVLINSWLSSPCLLGWLRPAVMIPASLRPISADVLAHELAHLRRHDCFWNLLGHLTTALLPWQPLLWLLSRRMEQAADNVCDDYVVAHQFDRVSYARELVTIAERFPASWSATTAAVGIAEFQSCLGSRVQRILDCSRTLSLQTGWKNLILVFAVALAGTAVAGLLGTARNGLIPGGDDVTSGEAIKLESAALPFKEGPTEIQVSGVVLKPDGTPAVGAMVRSAVPWRNMGDSTSDSFTPQMYETKADSEGRFTITVNKQPFVDLGNIDDYWLQSWKKTVIASSLAGFGPAWVKYDNIQSDKPFILRLVDDLPIRGRLIDLEGHPVKETNVNISRMRTGTDETIVAKWLDATIAHTQLPWASYLDAWVEVELRLVGIPAALKTDKEGWFEIRGLGKDRVVNLTFDGETTAHRGATAICREMEPLTEKIDIPPYEEVEHLFGTTFKYVVAPCRPIQGIIVDATTGEPLSGVAIESFKIADFIHAQRNALKAVSDDAGRFRLVGLPKAVGNRILVVPNDNQPYFMRAFDVPDPTGIEPVTMKIELHRGIWIKGQVTDKLTHAPVYGVCVDYYPFRTNEFAQRLPEFDSNGNVDGRQLRYQTDLQGRYRVVGLPGRAIVGARSLLTGYLNGVGYREIDAPKDDRSKEFLTWGNFKPRPNFPSVMREINPTDMDQEVHLDLELDPGTSTNIRIVDEQGQEVKGTEIYGLTSQDYYLFVPASDKPVQRVINLAADENRTVIVRQKDRQIGRVIELLPSDEPGREVKVELLPLTTITGRLMKNGEPMSGLQIRIQPLTSKRAHVYLFQSLESDTEGRFRCTVPTGCDYNLSAEGPGITKPYPATITEKLSVKPGETIDLGELTLGTDKKFEPLKVAAVDANQVEAAKKQAAPVADEIQITGVVLKPDGTPAAGATIRSAAPMTSMLERGLARRLDPKMYEATADAAGKFSISVNRKPYADTGEVGNRHKGWPEPWKATLIGASMRGFGPAWVECKEFDTDKPIVLQLVEDHRVRGQIVDLEGNPLGGVTITIKELQAPQDGDLAAWLANVKLGEEKQTERQIPWNPFPRKLRDIEARLTGLPEKVTTDANGWITIQGMGKDRILLIEFDGGEVGYRRATVVSREMETLQQNIMRRQPQSTEPVFGSQFKFAASPSRPVEGIVVDASTGKPLAGVSIINATPADSYIIDRQRLMKSVSDNSGRFRLMGMTKGDKNRLWAFSEDDQPYFIRTVNVPNPPGLDPIELKIELHRGIWIKGRVTDKVTHEPVPAVSLHYYPFLTNEFAARVPNFRAGGSVDNYRNQFMTDAEGSYRLIGLPGRAIVGATSLFKRYRPGAGADQVNAPMDVETKQFPTWDSHWLRSIDTAAVREINPTVEEQEIRLDLELDPGLSTTIRIVDEQGQPVSGVKLLGYGVRDAVDEANAGVVTIELLGSDEKRIIHAFHEERNLGAIVNLEPPYDANRQITATLKPCAVITGRLLSAGEPMSDVQIQAPYGSPQGGLMQMILGRNIVTNADGRFRCPVIPGHEYRVVARGKGIPRSFFPVADQLTVINGETRDLGDLEFGKDGFRPVKVAAVDTSQVEPTKKPAPQVADEIQITGVVLKPDGTPAAGATIRSAAPVTPMVERALARKLSPKMYETIADSAGQFSISVNQKPYGDTRAAFSQIKSSTEPWKATLIAASLKGFGPAWIGCQEIELGKPVVLRLVEDLPIRGQIVDLEGSPVRGTKIKLGDVQAAKDENLTPWFDDVKQGHVQQEVQIPWYALSPKLRTIEARLIGLPEQLTTDDIGRLQIQGLGKDRLLHLALEGGDVAYRRATVVAREMETLQERVQGAISRQGTEPVFGSQFTFAVPPSRPIEGIIADAETGKPISGISIENAMYAGFRFSDYRRILKAVSDDAGRFRLMGMTKGDENRVRVTAGQDQPYFGTSLRVPNPSGLEPIQMKIELHRGIWIKGRVTDKVTHEPVPGVHVHYFPFLTNEFAKRVSQFGSNGTMQGDFDQYRTDADGFYRLLGLPGRAIIGAESRFKSYREGYGAEEISASLGVNSDQLPVWGARRLGRETAAMREVNPGADAQEATLDLELDPGLSTKIRVVDEKGQAIKGTTIMAHVINEDEVNADDGVSTIGMLGPNEKLSFFAYHQDRKLGAKVELEPPYEPGRETKVVLMPCGVITGRLLNDGIPMPDLRLSNPTSMQLSLEVVATDNEGRFRCPAIPGYEYYLSAHGKGLPRQDFLIASKVVAASGETKDLGDLEVAKGGFQPAKVAPPETSKVESPKEPQLQFAGSVNDPDGKPLANAKVYAMAYRRETPSDSDAKAITLTDRNGHFQLTASVSEYQNEWEYAHIVAVADGYGFAARSAVHFETTGKLKASRAKMATTPASESQAVMDNVLKLVRDDVPLTGRIVNAEGQPVPGVRIRISGTWWNDQGSLDAWEKVAAGKTADYYSLRNETPNSLGGQQLPSIVSTIRTTDDGRFTMRGIGRDRVVKLVISGPGIELAEVHARTRKGDSIVVPHQWERPPGLKETYYATDFVHVGAPSVPVIGQVIDIETNKPIEGVRIGPGFLNFWTMRGPLDLFTITDAEGRYRLDGLPIKDGQTLLAFPRKESLYLPAGQRVSTKPGQSEVVTDFQFRKGVLLEGRAVDSQTREAIPGHVTYYAFLSNEHLKKFPGFDSLSTFYERGADSNGHFKIPVVPGAGILTFSPTDSRKYSRGQGADLIKEGKEMAGGNRIFSTVPTSLIAVNAIALQRVEIPEGAATAEVTVQIKSGADIEGKLVDADGNAVTGAIVTGQDGIGDTWHTLADAAFRVRAFYPESPRTLGAYHPDRDIGAVYLLDKVPSEPLTITLHPCGGIRGRLLDQNGIPMSDVVLSGNTVPEQHNSDKRQFLKTDDEGRFEIRGLIPGREYTVTGRLKSKPVGTVLNAVSIDAANMKDIGELKLDNDRKFQPVKITAIETGKIESPKEQPLQFAGTVVDPEGKPAKNARIYAVAVRPGYVLDSNAKPLAITDGNGQFQVIMSMEEFRNCLVDYDNSFATSSLVAAADGYGLARIQALACETTGQLETELTTDQRSSLEAARRDTGRTLRLVQDDVPLTGRILDSEGQPVVGARVRLAEIYYNKDGSLDSWMKATTEDKADFYRIIKEVPFRMNRGQLPSAVPDAVTTEDGRFTMRGIGRERLVRLVISGPGIEWADVFARTQKGNTIVLPHQWNGRAGPAYVERFYATDFVHVAPISIPIVGRVTDAETGKPIEGVRIDPGTAGFVVGYGSRYLFSITDNDGRYRLAGTRVEPEQKLKATPPGDSRYLPGGESVRMEAGQTEAVRDIQLRAGVLVQGRAVDSRTGQPITGTVGYHAFVSNVHLNQFVGFRQTGPRYEQHTDRDGRFKIAVLPGAGILWFRATVGQNYSRGQGAELISESNDMPLKERIYRTVPNLLAAWTPNALQRVDFDAGTTTAEVNFQVESGVDVEGKLIDPDGKPIVGALASIRNDGNGWVSLSDSTFKVRGFYPNTARTIAFYDMERDLAAVLQLDNTPSEPLTITLQPAGRLRGRLIDKDGVAMSQVELSGMHFPHGKTGGVKLHLATDDEGRFEMFGLVPGYKYSVDGISKNRHFKEILKDVSIDTVGMKDIGDVSPQPIMKK